MSGGRKYVARGEVQKGLFGAMHEQSKLFGESNDCAVKAVAVVCEVTYGEAWQALAARGRKKRRTTRHNMIFDAVRALGKKTVGSRRGFVSSFGVDEKVDGISFEARMLARLETEYGYQVKNLTTRQLTMFPGLLDGETGVYLAFTNCHVVAVARGQVHCWGADRALRIYETVGVV